MGVDASNFSLSFVRVERRGTSADTVEVDFPAGVVNGSVFLMAAWEFLLNDISELIVLKVSARLVTVKLGFDMGEVCTGGDGGDGGGGGCTATIVGGCHEELKRGGNLQPDGRATIVGGCHEEL